jgi:hypothetical protein
MWPEWRKEGLTAISLIPERMELDYLYRMNPDIRQAADSLSAPGNQLREISVP